MYINPDNDFVVRCDYSGATFLDIGSHDSCRVAALEALQDGVSLFGELTETGKALDAAITRLTALERGAEFEDGSFGYTVSIKRREA